VTRRSPKEEAVRDQLRDRDGSGAPEDADAPERPQEEAADEAAVAESEAVAEQEPEPEQEKEPDPVAELEAERDKYLQLAQRTQADFENYRKRAAKEMAAAGERAKVGLLRDLLPVVDNLERALDSAQNGGAGLAEGVRLVLSELQGVLAREGVEALEPAGESFDPTVHEALSTRAEDGAEPGVVLDVVEKGYRMSDTVIRPARVVVSA
jgi:molecular chaperone GrpE